MSLEKLQIPTQVAENKRPREDKGDATDEGHDRKRRCCGRRSSDESDAAEMVVKVEEKPDKTGDSSSAAEPYSLTNNDGSKPEPEARPPSASVPRPDDAADGAKWEELIEVARPMLTGSLLPEEYERAALVLLNGMNREPDGTNIRRPGWYRGRHQAFRVDKGVVRPREMMDDFRDRQKTRASSTSSETPIRKKRSPSPEPSIKEERSASPEPSIKQESS